MPERLLGNELPMPLVFAERLALALDIGKEGSRRASNKHLDRFLYRLSALALPDMPSLFEDLIDMPLLELERDEELRRVVEDWIVSNEKALLRIDSKQKGCV